MKLENWVLVFADSCEEICRRRHFNIAVAGRHKKIHCFLFKHNLFHQSKSSRTIDLNTTHVVQFKSPSDVQQIDHFGSHLNDLEVIRNCYQNATSPSYGHFLIDFDPKTSEFLQFSSTFTGPGPTIFYLSSSLAKVATLRNETEKGAYTEALAKQSEKES